MMLIRNDSRWSRRDPSRPGPHHARQYGHTAGAIPGAAAGQSPGGNTGPGFEAGGEVRRHAAAAPARRACRPEHAAQRPHAEVHGDRRHDPRLRQGGQEERRRRVHVLHDGGQGSAGDVRVQRRSGRGIRVPESRCDRTRNTSSSATKATVRPNSLRSSTTPAPGWICRTSSSSIPWAPVSAGRT